MFDNTGVKIKIVSYIIAIGGILFCIYGFLSGLSDMSRYFEYWDAETSFKNFFSLFLGSAVGCFFSWLSGLLLYALGTRVDNSERLVYLAEKQNNNNTVRGNDAPLTHSWRCSCGALISSYPCPNCGANPIQTEPSLANVYSIQIEGLDGNPVCSKCGEPFASESRFCSNCGNTNHLLWSEDHNRPCSICRAVTDVIHAKVIYNGARVEVKQVCGNCIRQYSVNNIQPQQVQPQPMQQTQQTQQTQQL